MYNIVNVGKAISAYFEYSALRSVRVSLTAEGKAMNAVACLAWVRRGAARPRPDRVRLSDNELTELVGAAGPRSEDDDEGGTTSDVTAHSEVSSARKRKAGDDGESEEAAESDDSGEGDQSEGKAGSSGDKSVPSGDKASGTGDRVVDTYSLDDYDDDEDVSSRAVSMSGTGRHE